MKIKINVKNGSFFAVQGDGDASLGMPDIELLNILQINCNRRDTKKEKKDMNDNENKRNAINVGSEQCYANPSLEKDCDKKDNNAYSCTNTGSSLNSNNRPHNASLSMVTSLQMVKDTAVDYLLSGMTNNDPVTVETKMKLIIFFQVQTKRMTKEQVPI